jgi:uncharacterized RDD family membrane protein YckC
MSEPQRPQGSPDFTSPGNPPAGGMSAGSQPQGQPAGGALASGSIRDPYPPPHPYTQPVYPAAGYPSGLAAPLPLRTDYASWGKRALAYLIDFFPNYITLAVFYAGYLWFVIQVSRDAASPASPPGTALTLMIIGGILMLAALGWNIYNRWLVGGRTGQSWGKRAVKISLLSEQTGQPIGPLNAFLRDLLHILDGMAYVGFLWPLWDDKRQTFADMLMKTVVVLTPEQPSQ